MICLFLFLFIQLCSWLWHVCCLFWESSWLYGGTWKDLSTEGWMLMRLCHPSRSLRSRKKYFPKDMCLTLFCKSKIFLIIIFLFFFYIQRSSMLVLYNSRWKQIVIYEICTGLVHIFGLFFFFFILFFIVFQMWAIRLLFFFVIELYKQVASLLVETVIFLLYIVLIVVSLLIRLQRFTFLL